MRYVIVFTIFLLLLVPSLSAQVPPRVDIVGCSGQPLTGNMSFSASISGSNVTINRTATPSPVPSYSIADGIVALRSVSSFPLVISYGSTTTNRSFQLFAADTEGNTDCVQGRVYFNANCTWTVDSERLAVPSAASTPSVALARTSGTCGLSVTDFASWITPASLPSPLTSSFSLNVSIPTSTLTTSRTGLLHIGENVITITQAAQRCTSSVSVSGVSVGAGPIASSLNVTMPSGCAWTVSGAPAWVTPSVNGGTGTGSAQVVTLNFQANPSSLSRSGTIIVAGRKIYLTQAGARCLFTLAPASRFAQAGGAGVLETATFRVSAPTGCAWTAVSGASWLTFPSTQSGSGNGTVTYLIAHNPSSTTRRAGRIFVGGRTFTVTQLPQGPSLRCAVPAAPTPKQLRFGGLTELVANLPFDCTGTAPSRSTTVEITLRLTAPITSKVINTTTRETEALLLIDYNPKIAPVLGQTARMGRLAGPNALKWTVPISSFLADNAITFDFANVRVNTAGLVLGTRSLPLVKASVEIRSLEALTIDSGDYTVGQAYDAYDYSIGELVVSRYNFLSTTGVAPVTVSARLSNTFLPRQLSGQTTSILGNTYLAESGFMHTNLGNASIGLATSGTKILLDLPPIPRGMSVAVENDSTDGSAVLVEPRPQKDTTPVTSQAVFEFTSTTLRPKTLTFNVLITGGTSTQRLNLKDGIVVSLAPASNVASASATAAIPRFVDADGPNVVDMRVVPGRVSVPPIQIRSESKTAVLMAEGNAAIGSNFTFNYDIYNDSSEAATGTVIRGNAPPGFTYVSCTPAPCTVAPGGSTLESNIGTFPPGESISLEVQAAQTGELPPPGMYVENSIDVSSDDLDSDQDSNSGGSGFIVETCGALAVNEAAFRFGGGTGTISVPGSCTWTAASTVDWITLTGATSGSSAASIPYSVASNLGGNQRVGTILVGGRTFQVTQTPVCSYSVTPSSLNPSSAPGGQSVTVSIAGQGCSWTSSSAEGWLSTTPTGASVSGAVLVNWLANSSTATRAGTVRFGNPDVGFNVQVSQAGAACTYSLNPTSAAPVAGGGTGNVTVTTNGTNCPWTPVSNAGWLTITSPGPGTGTAAFTWSAAANPNASQRVGTITAGGQTFTVTQAAGACTYSISSTAGNAVSAGGTGQFTLTTNGPACAWNTSSNAAWLTLTPTSGTTTTVLTWTAASNATTSQRTGVITTTGGNFTVTQSAVGCSFTLSSSTANAPVGGGTGMYSVNANGANCDFTASSDSPTWLTVTPTAATGTRTLTWTAAANGTTSPRTGIITAAGLTFTVSQPAAACSFSVSPGSANSAATASTGGFVLTSNGSNCAWTATSNLPDWLTVSPGSGTGSANLTWNTTANGTLARSGQISVGGQTFTVTQAAVPCTWSLSSSSATPPAAGQTSSFTIISNGSNCAWTVASSAAWLTVTTPSGSGTATITWTAAANTATTARSATLTLGGQTFTVTQAAAACTYAFSSASGSAASTGGTGSVGFTTNGSNCAWTATSDSAWLTFTPANGTGTGTLNWTAAANGAAASRVATISAMGRTYSVTQSAAGCTFDLSTTTGSATDAGGTGSFDVTANGPGCSWTATSSAEWLTVSPESGNPPATITWTATANPVSATRTATITVGGRVVTITQTGPGCTFTISSNSANVPAAGQFGGFTLTASGPACAWTAASSQPWLEVSPASGAGTATINWNAATNTSLSARNASITVGGQTFSVAQAAAACTFALSAPSAAAPFTGLASSVTLTASVGGCAWTARSNASWAQVGQLTGNGTSTVTFNVFPNFNSTPRSATLTIAGQPFTITQAATPGTARERFVRLLYFSYLGRLPTDAELAFQAGGPATNVALAQNFFQAEEFNLVGRFVAGIYVGLLARDAEYGGWQFQRNGLAAGASTQFGLIGAFLGSPEYIAKFGNPSDVEFVRLLYRYVLLREAQPGEAEFHAGGIPSLGRVGVARAFLNSTEFRTGTQGRLNAFLLYASLLMRDGNVTELEGLRTQLETGGAAALQTAISNFVNSAELANLTN